MSDLPIGRYEGPVRLVAAPDDLQRAMHDICQEGVIGFDIETRPAFRTGVRNLAASFFGKRIPKGVRTTNWAARRLTPQQVAYAATDAWVCAASCISASSS